MKGNLLCKQDGLAAFRAGSISTMSNKKTKARGSSIAATLRNKSNGDGPYQTETTTTTANSTDSDNKLCFTSCDVLTFCCSDSVCPSMP